MKGLLSTRYEENSTICAQFIRMIIRYVKLIPQIEKYVSFKYNNILWSNNIGVNADMTREK